MEINLLESYPQAKRNVSERGNIKTDEDKKIARQFGKEFFDGDRRYGYGGYSYDSRFWELVVPDFQKQYSLNDSSSILDVGCGKGFMLFDFSRLIPGITVSGIDISEYAIKNSMSEVKEHLRVGCASKLPYEDNTFDVAISINTIHNLDRDKCKLALQELERVSKVGSFVSVDAYRTEEEKKRMEDWNLTAKTFMHVDEWKVFFAEAGYTGDYYWFIP